MKKSLKTTYYVLVAMGLYSVMTGVLRDIWIVERGVPKLALSVVISLCALNLLLDIIIDVLKIFVPNEVLRANLQ